MTTQITRPKLVVIKSGPAEANLNDALSYRLEVRNAGNASAQTVVLRDVLPEGLEAVGGKDALTWDLGTSRPARRSRRNIGAGPQDRLVVQQGDGDGVRRLQRGGAELRPCRRGPAATGAEGTGKGRGESAGVLSVDGQQSRHGPLANVQLDDALPLRASLLSVSDGGRQVGAQVQWQLGRLGVNERRTVQMVLSVPEAGEVIDRTTASADRFDKVSAETKALFEGITGLTAEVAVKNNPLELGAETTYLVTVHNQGNAPATHVSVVATVPEQMNVVDAHGPTGHKFEGPRVVFEPQASLAPRAEARFEIVVKARAVGDARFEVVLNADQLAAAGPVRKQQGTTIFSTNQATPTGRIEPVPVPVPPAGPQHP